MPWDSIYPRRMLPLPLQTYILILVGLVTRDQEEVIAYLQAENKVLREQLDVALDGKRLRFTERQRRRLAEFGRRLGWRRLASAALGVSAAPLETDSSFRLAR